MKKRLLLISLACFDIGLLLAIAVAMSGCATPAKRPDFSILRRAEKGAAKISDYSLATAPAGDDVVVGIDTSDTTMAPTGTTKKFRLLDFPISTAAQTALDAKQDQDTDLTAIAALTTTAYGRNLLTLTGQSDLLSLLPSYQPADSDLDSAGNNKYWGTNSSGVVGFWDLSAGSMVYPGAGVPYSAGSAWGTSYPVVTTLGSPGSDANLATEAAIRAAITAAGGMSSLSDDTAPLLGGDLGLNGQSITNWIYNASDCSSTSYGFCRDSDDGFLYYFNNGALVFSVDPSGAIALNGADGTHFLESLNTTAITATATAGRIGFYNGEWRYANGTDWTSDYLLRFSHVGSILQGYSASLSSWASVLRGSGFDTAAGNAANSSNGFVTGAGAGTLANKSIVTLEVDGSSSGSLTVSQVSNTAIYNTGQAASDVALGLPTAAAGYSALFTVGTTVANKWGVQAGTNDKIYILNSDGTISAGADNGYARMTNAQIGQSFACWTFKTDAYDWMCKAVAVGTSAFAAN